MRQMLILLLLLPVFVWAESIEKSQAQIRQYESELVRIQQEAQAAHQQFLMIQELRRHEIHEIDTFMQPIVTTKSVPFPNHNDMIKKKQEKQARIRQYSDDLDTLYLQHRELEDRRVIIYNEIDLLKTNLEE